MLHKGVLKYEGYYEIGRKQHKKGENYHEDKEEHWVEGYKNKMINLYMIYLLDDGSFFLTLSMVFRIQF